MQFSVRFHYFTKQEGIQAVLMEKGFFTAEDAEIAEKNKTFLRAALYISLSF